jgi:histidine ammonia-lyase
LSATQALDFRRPLKSSPTIEKLYGAFRNKVSFNEADRLLHNDMVNAIDFLKNYNLIEQ